MSHQNLLIDVGLPKAPAGKAVTPSVLIKECSAVVEHYHRYHPRAKPDEKTRALIRARLNDGYSIKDLCDAIDGCHRSPHNCGENERGQKYQQLDLIMRNAGQVTRFIEISKPKAERYVPPPEANAPDEVPLPAGEGKRMLREALTLAKDIGRMPK